MQLTEKQKVEAALRRLRNKWGEERVKHYGWHQSRRRHIELLASLCGSQESWADFVSNLNMVMLQRHKRGAKKRFGVDGIDNGDLEELKTKGQTDTLLPAPLSDKDLPPGFEFDTYGMLQIKATIKTEETEPSVQKLNAQIQALGQTISEFEEKGRVEAIGGAEVVFKFREFNAMIKSALSQRDQSSMTTDVQQSPPPSILPGSSTSPSNTQEERRHVKISSLLNHTSDTEQLIKLAKVLNAFEKTTIPGALLVAGLQPHRSWGPDGELKETEPLGLGPLFTTSTIHSAIERLQNLRIITLKEGPLGHPDFSFNEALLQEARVQAVKLLIHHFPTDGHTEPLHYTTFGRAALPHLQRACSYLDSTFLAEFSVDELDRLIETLLSASFFGDPQWKRGAITLAEELASCSKNHHLWARLALRKRCLSRLYPDQQWSKLESFKDIQDGLKAVDARSNAFFGELLAATTQELIDRHELSEAWRESEKFKAWNPNSPSTREQFVMDSITVLQGNILRFQGNFLAAAECFRSLLESCANAPERSRSAMKAVPRLVGICCELGRFSEAIHFISFELQRSKEFDWLSTGTARTQRLALADTHLMRALWRIRGDGVVSGIAPEAKEFLKAAKENYEQLSYLYNGRTDLGLTGARNRFSASVGLAMISHLVDVEEIALERWSHARECAKKCIWKLDFVQMMITYSLARSAFEIYSRVKRQTHFTGLGTIWPDVIGDMIEHRGLRRIVPRWHFR